MNKHIVIGNIGQEPEIRHTESGTTVANFTIASNWFRKDPTSGEKLQETDWIRCVAWGKRAELIEKYVKKGDKIGIVGRVVNRSWQTDTGETKYITETNVDEIEFLSSKQSNNQAEQPPFTSSSDDDDLPF